MNEKYGCAMLAGGAGSRMGNINKAKLEYRGRSFAESIMSEMMKTGMSCYLSVANYKQPIPEGWQSVRDAVTGREGEYIGPMGGIYSCLVLAEKDGLDGLFFVPCDTPLYTAEAVKRLRCYITDETDAVLWKTPDGRLQMTAGWYSVRCAEPISKEISEGRSRLRNLADKFRCRIISTDEDGLDSRLFININRPEDYRELENNNREVLTLEKAVSLLSEAAAPIRDIEAVSLTDACGRTLAEDIRACHDQPPFPRSPLDGYAVRAVDTSGATREDPAELKVICEIDAGQHYDGRLEQGTAVRIMTGAPIPAGADAVIGQEDTDYGEDTVKIYLEMRPHQNYCDQGEDYRKGDVLISEREHIGPSECGIIASAGRNSVKVYRRPRALLISTGDEVVMPGEELSSGKIYDSNLFTVASQLEEWGVELTGMLHAGDDPDQLVRIIENRLDENDIVVTTGGVSVGNKDILHDVYHKMGIEKLFWKVAIKPGMAMLSGRYRNTIFLSLSGNPYAAYVDLQLMVRPVLDALNGNEHLRMQRTEVVLMDDYSKRSPSRRLVRAFLRDGKAYIEGHTGGNGVISSSHGANALVDIPAGTGKLKAGETVSVLII